MAGTEIYRTRIRYANSCFVCGKEVPVGVQGWYDPARKKIACGDHDLSGGSAVEAPEVDGRDEPAAVDTDGLPKLIKAKYDSTCAVCGTQTPRGEQLFWVVGTKVVVCPACTAGEVAAGMETGPAGGGASRMADAATRKHAERLLAAYPMLGEHLIANARPTDAMHAWMRGADGERIVGRRLDIGAEEGRIVVLHDRRTPWGGNIDHLVIGPRRISVIDAKHYRKARITKENDTLMVAGKPAEHLIDGVRRQSAAVQDALASQPRLAENTGPILAFVAGKLGFSGSIVHRGVWCGTLQEAVSYAMWRHVVLTRHPIKLDAEARAEVAALLARAFPPY